MSEHSALSSRLEKDLHNAHSALHSHTTLLKTITPQHNNNNNTNNNKQKLTQDVNNATPSQQSFAQLLADDTTEQNMEQNRGETRPEGDIGNNGGIPVSCKFQDVVFC